VSFLVREAPFTTGYFRNLESPNRQDTRRLHFHSFHRALAAAGANEAKDCRNAQLDSLYRVSNGNFSYIAAGNLFVLPLLATLNRHTLRLCLVST
jgi:hypothetical protein